MAFENITTEDKGRIRLITVNRESKLNALNRATLTELHTAITAAIADSAIGGLIITGAGNKAFVAGADIAEFVQLDEAGGLELSRQGHEQVFNLIANSAKPVIAAINGFALGGGLELALACHIRIAAETAKLGLPEVTLGLIPGYGGTQRLTHLIGKGRALEMILSADMITANEAWQFGLVNHVVSGTDLLANAEQLMQKILLRAPLAVASAIKAVNAAETPEGFSTEISEFGKCFGTADFKEGVSAFLEKRKASFKGK